ncbi:MAG: alpha/beta hydrolase [Microcoleaceae cyanobacterium]
MNFWHRSHFQQAVKTIVSTLALTACSLGISTPKPARSAEEIVFSYPPAEIYMSVEGLETFITTGEITGDFGAYASFFDPETLEQARGILNNSVNWDPDLVNRVVTMPIGDVVMRRVGQLIQVDRGVNGAEALQTALVEAASDPEGLSLLKVIEKFPSERISIDVRFVLQALDEFSTWAEYRDVVAETIQAESTKEAAAEPPIDPGQLSDQLQQPGPYSFTRRTLSFEVGGVRQTEGGLTGNYQLDVDLYIPEGLSEPAPLVISSHGFGASRENSNQAQHLVSHGYVVAIPEHVGSSLGYRESFLRGAVDLLLSPIEYISRPQEVSAFLDEIEKRVKTDPDLAKSIDLDQIGVVGNSFGGTTALAVGGAELSPQHLTEICRPERFSLNISLLLQCRAVHLPKINYNFRDPRVKAIISAHPLTSGIYGPQGMSTVEVPTLMVAGSNDIVTPVVQEQVNAFIALGAPEKYLAYIVPGTHFSSTVQGDTPGISAVPEFIIGNNFDLGRPHFFGISAAFFNLYLRGEEEYRPYLSATYNRSLSQEGFDVSLIRDLTEEQIETAYGAPSPIPVELVPIAEVPQVPSQDILEEIKRTKVLKVAIRQDASPFGYRNQNQQLRGYCMELMQTFSYYLEDQLEIPGELELVVFPSNIDNRYRLVQNDTVHLECGPNTIQINIPNVTFSQPFFITGNHFLAKKKNETQIDPSGTLAGVDTGVVKNSVTEQFLRKQYPEANPTYFRGDSATTNGINAVVEDRIQTFIGDGILSMGEIFNQKLPVEDYTLIPEDPLTCDFYGMVLPVNDSKWRRMVNEFVNSQDAEYIWTRWFSFAVPYVLVNVDFCINR